MNSRKRAEFLICLSLAVALWIPPQIARAQGTILNPNSPNTQTDPPAPAKPVIPASPPNEEATSRLTLENLNKELEEFQKLEGQDKLQEMVIPLLTQAVKFLEGEQKLRTDAEKLRVDPKAIAEQVEQLQKRLDQKPADPAEAEEVRRYQSPEEAKEQLQQLEQEILDAETLQKEQQLRSDTRSDRLENIPNRRREIEQRLPAIRESLSAKAPEDDHAALTQTKQVLLRAEQQSLLQEQSTIKQEEAFYKADAERLDLELKASKARIDQLQKISTALDRRLLDLEQQATKSQVSEARELLQHAPDELQSVAHEIQELANLLSSPEAPLTQKEAFVVQLAEADRLLRVWFAKEKATRKRIDDDIRADILAPIINDQRSRLPSVYVYAERELAHRQSEMEYRGQILNYEDRYEELEDLEDELSALLTEVPANQQNQLRQEAVKLLEREKELLSSLKKNYEELVVVLEKLSETEGELVRFTREYGRFLKQESLWVPVAEVFSFASFQQMRNSRPLYLHRENWLLLAHTMGSEILRAPIISFILLISLIAYFPVHRMFKKSLQEISEQIANEILPPLSLTRRAMMMTFALSLWIPSLIWIVGNRLRRVLPDSANIDVNPAFVPAVGHALMSIAVLVGILRLTRYLVRASGLGEVHFRWPQNQLKLVRRHLSWYTPTIVPLYFAFEAIRNLGTPEDRRNLGRFLLMITMLITAGFLYRILVPARSRDERSSVKKLSVWERLSIYGPCLVPLLIVLLSWSGYTYTSSVLTERSIDTAGILLLLTMGYELGYRGIYLARGRLALEQTRLRQEAKAAQENEEETSEMPPTVDPQDVGIDLSTINAQTRQLLSTSYRLAVFIALWFLWGDVTPQIPLLEYELTAPQQMTEILNEGEESQSTVVRMTDPLKVGDVFLAGLIAVVTFIASRNIPSLMEITVLQNLPLDTGIRYAAGMISRYVVIAVGVLLAASVLGFESSDISIMMGGLAVGLGFGLQELFANFVSGLILLFEQPLRIGDVVTLGDVTGSVTRIRIRATTITDWDRQEYIVPNKELITGKFKNWTLSDKINRIVIPVGVAYGADTERARELLLKVCREHPEIMKEPGPSAIFDAFGDSALNITLRCYLPNLDNRLQVTHQLYSAIDRAFQHAGIEIAFPQMDLHLRSIDPIQNPVPVSTTGPKS